MVPDGALARKAERQAAKQRCVFLFADNGGGLALGVSLKSFNFFR